MPGLSLSLRHVNRRAIKEERIATYWLCYITLFVFIFLIDQEKNTFQILFWIY